MGIAGARGPSRPLYVGLRSVLSLELGEKCRNLVKRVVALSDNLGEVNLGKRHPGDPIIRERSLDRVEHQAEVGDLVGEGEELVLGILEGRYYAIRLVAYVRPYRDQPHDCTYEVGHRQSVG